MEAADGVFLALVSFFSSIWYIGRLGFYSDDWGLFAAFQLSPDRSIAGLLRPSFVDRPLQGIYSILLYRAFGLHPFGYHLVNAVALASGVVLLYLVLRRLQPSRTCALGVALIYAVLPNFTTDRFWFAAFAAPLSIVFYLLSLLMDLDAANKERAAWLARRGAALAAMLVSLLLYETALPLFLLNPLLAHYRGRRGWRFSMDLGINAVTIAAVAVYKIKTSPRMHAPHGVMALMSSIARNLFRRGFKNGDYGLNLPAAFRINFIDDVFRLPAILWRLQHQYPHAWLPPLALAFGIAIFLYVRRMPADFTLRQSLTCIGGGVLVFLAGYSTFLTNEAIQLTATGIGNRTSIAAALGVAVVAAGLAGVIAHVIPAPVRSAAFAGLTGAFAAMAFFTISTLSGFWIDAYAAARSIESDIEQHAGALHQSTLLLGGVCSYSGPAIIFESDWDLSGLLRLRNNDRTISADVLRPGYYAVTASGIETTLYEGEDDYDFAPNLLLYDFGRKTVTALSDRATAVAALQGGRVDAKCEEGSEGVGSKVPGF